jgi:hypothetical protein
MDSRLLRATAFLCNVVSRLSLFPLASPLIATAPYYRPEFQRKMPVPGEVLQDMSAYNRKISNEKTAYVEVGKLTVIG